MALGSFISGNDLVQYGRQVKASGGSMDIFFPRAFSGNPIVIVTPFWEGGGQVGYVETVTNVDNNKFTVTSNNAASNYYVSWVAFGPN